MNNNAESVIMALVTTLLPGVDLSMNLISSSEKHLIIETGLVRCSMGRSNKGTQIDPDWAAPNVRYIMQYGVNGYTIEQSSLIVEQFIKLNTIFSVSAVFLSPAFLVSPELRANPFTSLRFSSSSS